MLKRSIFLTIAFLLVIIISNTPAHATKRGETFKKVRAELWIQGTNASTVVLNNSSDFVQYFNQKIGGSNINELSEPSYPEELNKILRKYKTKNIR